ncbi:helix-turn-helix domain-containing protein [Streptomyces sanyensis]|uniref:helix-turn-helix domain-containing protein n=1 Tax=Streptomyces sanyensis TaxID=568869 RepID=UPI003D77240F
MHEKNDTPDAALTALRARLETGRARMRLNQTQLAARAGLSRGTVHKVFKAGEPVPTTDTVVAVARALGLPVGELLALRRTAVGAGDGDRAGPGRPVGQWDPHALEVHPAGMTLESAGGVERRVLPGYVAREHDQRLARAVQDAEAGRSRMVVLVGESSTGKTRACWEAVQPLADQGWWLWHPYDPTRAEAALEELHRVGPRTVVWLNEAQHYLGDPHAGERIAAAIHTLLVQPERGPVLVLGTLWPDYATQYTALPSPEAPDPHSRVRELLAARTVNIPAAFDPAALAKATTLAEAGDRLLADALTRAGDDGRVTQDLAGAPELLHRYEQATPAARALLEAAMDARRLRVGLHLPQAFLTDAAPDYLTDTDYDQLTDDWAEQAYAELATPVHGKHAPLRRATPRPQRRPPSPTPTDSPTPSPGGPVFRLADYLEQHGRTTRPDLCPPASFWHAAHTHLTHPDDLNYLAQAAEDRHRLQWAHHLRHRAAHHGGASALACLAVRREQSGDHAGAEALARQAAEYGDPSALVRLAVRREQNLDRACAKTLYQEAADHGSSSALVSMSWMLMQSGDHAGAEALTRQAAERGDPSALARLSWMRDQIGDHAGAEALTRQAAEYGDPSALVRLAVRREQSGDHAGAEALARQAAERGDPSALVRLGWMREQCRKRADAEDLYQMAADHGSPSALVRLATMWEEDGARKGAEVLARQAADHGDSSALVRLSAMRERVGAGQSAETLARDVAGRGDPSALVHLAAMREQIGDREGVETLRREAAEHGDPSALVRLATIREQTGDSATAEVLARQAAEHGDPSALVRLATIREQTGDSATAEVLARQAAEHGDPSALVRLATIREQTGDSATAEVLARQAAEHGDPSALVRLAATRKQAGDQDGEEGLYRRAADHGHASALVRLATRQEQNGKYMGALQRLWPYGLDPDGTPTPAWQDGAAE